MDIVLPDENFSAQWNLGDDEGLWILKDHSVEQVGCIHTCQGLELDYIGVIFGHDLVIRNGQWVEYPGRRDKGDKSIKGYYKLALSDHAAAQNRAREIIRNTYRTLMTRGLKGCYLYSVDPETNAYLKIAAQSSSAPVSTPTDDAPEVLPFEILPPDQVQPYKNCVPCFPDIKVAAGAFATELHTADQVWIALPEGFSARPGYFVVRVRGESMNRRIPNGSWCLFRSNPAGSREGRVVLVEHRDVRDEDFGACTVKIYHSTKTADADSWKHASITLSPDSTNDSFQPIHLSPSSDDAFRVVGELVAVISQ